MGPASKRHGQVVVEQAQPGIWRVPARFASEWFYALTAYNFTNNERLRTYGQYRIWHDGGNVFVDAFADVNITKP